MPETLNHLKDLAFLKDRIATNKAKGESTEALEACLSLRQTLAKEMKPAVSHIEKTIPSSDK